MFVTAPVCQVEMLPLKALAPLNTVKKKVVREETVFKHMRLQLTVLHVRHCPGIPAPDDTVRIARRSVCSGKSRAGPVRCFTQTGSNSSLQSSCIRGCEYGSSSGEHGQKKY